MVFFPPIFFLCFLLSLSVLLGVFIYVLVGLEALFSLLGRREEGKVCRRE